MLEENFQRSLALTRGDYGIFVSSPLSIALVGVCVLALVFGAIRPAITAILKKKADPFTPVSTSKEKVK